MSFKAPLVFDGTATPVKTALFVIVLLAWLLPGLTGHDPWRPDEAAAMGVIVGMLRDGHWWLPHIAGGMNADYPPLYHWVAAAFAKLLPFLPTHDAARLATGFFLGLAILYLHKTANRLFDERAGRISVALFIGSLGLLLRGHELNPEVAVLAGTAIGLYGMAQLRFDARKGGITAGIGGGIVALSVGIIPALIMPLSALALLALLHDWRNRSFVRGIVLTTIVLLACAAFYPAILALRGELSATIIVDAVLGSPLLDGRSWHLLHPGYLISILPWYALPTLPIALWLWRKERRQLRERIELALPLSAFVTMLALLSLAREARDATALPLLLPLALAAAYALDRLPRGVASFLDWFSLAFFGCAALAVWLYWIAALAGVPEAAARAVARQVPGFVFHFSTLAVALAATLTALWAIAVACAHRNNRRAIVNWAAGITLVWVLVNLLGLDAIDHVRRYRAPVSSVAERIAAAPGCVVGVNIGEPQRAMFDYYRNIRFRSPKSPDRADCPWMLVQGTKANAPDFDATWRLEWEGARPADRVEQFRLYRRGS